MHPRGAPARALRRARACRVDTVRGFRDKQLMKERVAAAGLRVPRVRAASAPAPRRAPRPSEIGYPLILKPIAGAGSADTYRVDERRASSSGVARRARGTSPRRAVEEFIEGEEFTFDTVCIGGKPAFENVAAVPAEAARSRGRNEWISPVIITVRDMRQPKLSGGIALGARRARRARHGRRLHPHGVVPQGRTARSCSARSAAGRAARTSSTR